MKKNCFARFAAAALSLAMLAGCGASQSSDSAAVDTGSADSAEPTVFAAASMTETLNQIAEDYKVVDPNVTLTFNFASSGDLLTQIKEGADCDVFISAAPKQMNALTALSRMTPTRTRTVWTSCWAAPVSICSRTR